MIYRVDRDKDTITDFILELVRLKNLTMDLILNRPGPYSRTQIQRSLYNLKKKKFIAFPSHTPTGRLLLTKLGMRRLNGIKFEKLFIKPVSWDGKWRLLTFDIPEKQSPIRHRFRRKLKELGFFHFQRSVFILPYPCQKEINMIIDHLEIAPDVHVLIAERFPGDGKLVKKFQLKSHVLHDR